MKKFDGIHTDIQSSITYTISAAGCKQQCSHKSSPISLVTVINEVLLYLQIISHLSVQCKWYLSIYVTHKSFKLTSEFLISITIDKYYAKMKSLHTNIRC